MKDTLYALSKEFRKIFQADGAVHAVGILVQLFKIFFHLVVFVPDFTNQFFQNILHRNNTKRSAEIIYDHGDMGLFMLEHFQNIPDFCVLIDEQRFRHDLRNGLIRHLCINIEVLLMKNADDLIDGILVDQQTRKAGLCKGSGNFLMTLADIHGLQINSMGQNFCRRQAAELKGIAQQLALIFVNAAVLLHILHEKKRDTSFFH